MNQTAAIEIGREAIMVVLTMSVPIMAVALFVGLIIALFQAFTQLQEMTLRSQQAQLELNRYGEFLKNYELSDKILQDPVKMERKINNGTKHAFEGIEKLSATVDDLDDGLQLQSNSN